MRALIHTFSILLLATALAAQTRQDFSMTVDSVQRSFIVSRPSGDPPPEGYPVVFMFHGTSGDGEKFYNISGWKEKGETEKFLTVFPSSLEYCIVDSGKHIQTTKWHCGELLAVACPGQIFKDDVGFVRRMVDTLKASFPVDRRRIYASGFSNGGCFTSKLAVEASDIFAAVSASAGPLSVNDSGNAVRNVPFWLTLGSKDDRWLEKLPFNEFPLNDSTLIALQRIINVYLGSFDLSEQHNTTKSAQTITWMFRTPASSEPATEFRFTVLKGVTHEYPNGKNYPITLADPLWTFFSQYSLPVTAVERIALPEVVRVYPNPASEFLVVEGAGVRVVTLRNLLGQTVFSSPASSGGAIRLPRLSPGVYQAVIEGAHSTAFKLVRILPS
jgi:polyhydroxybutyrate depolymerase